MDGNQTDLGLVVPLLKENHNSIENYFLKYLSKNW